METNVWDAAQERRKQEKSDSEVGKPLCSTLRVFCDPTIGLHSRAMVRIAEAVKRHKPSNVQIVDKQQDADLVLFYPIGFDWVDHFKQCISNGQKYAVVQCCLKTSGATAEQWLPWWLSPSCAAVWSFYRIDKHYEGEFYHAPLGIDPVFTSNHANGIVRRAIVTTGYVSHPAAEAIEEVWIAARLAGLINVYHIGPWPEGIDRDDGSQWKHVKVLGPNCSDDTVAWHYNIAKWVCSLRHTEGFELPAAEGLACGARPILFDQPDIKHWYSEHADYVPDTHGEELINHLLEVFTGQKRFDPRDFGKSTGRHYRPVENFERTQVKERFNWESIVKGFWVRILSSLYVDRSQTGRATKHDADRFAQLIERDEKEDRPVVHSCCGCSCHVCANGHATGQHSEKCQERILSECGDLVVSQSAVSQ